MNFMEAVKLMKEGKKVTRTEWKAIYEKPRMYLQGTQYHYIQEGINQARLSNHVSPEMTEATDWEIYEEEDNWNLGSKGIDGSSLIGWKYTTQNIKTFISKVKEDVEKKDRDQKTMLDFSYGDVFEIIDKRAGDL